MVRTIRGGIEVLNTFQPQLTKRELDVLYWLAEGKNQMDIATLLSCNHAACRQRLKRIMDKLGTSTAAGTVAFALRKGIIA